MNPSSKSDISIAVVELLQELTDADALNESEEGAEVLLDALVSNQPTNNVLTHVDQQVVFCKQDYHLGDILFMNVLLQYFLINLFYQYYRDQYVIRSQT